VKLLCLSAVIQSFLVDTVIFSDNFSSTQIAFGGGALALAAATFAVGAKNEAK